MPEGVPILHYPPRRRWPKMKRMRLNAETETFYVMFLSKSVALWDRSGSENGNPEFVGTWRRCTGGRFYVKYSDKWYRLKCKKLGRSVLTICYRHFWQWLRKSGKNVKRNIRFCIWIRRTDWRSGTVFKLKCWIHVVTLLNHITVVLNLTTVLYEKKMTFLNPNNTYRINMY